MNIKKIKLFFRSPFFVVVLKDRKKKASLFCLVCLAYLLAALLEGISFSLMIFALTALNDQLDIEKIPKFLQFFQNDVSPVYLFSFFILSAILLQVLRSALSYLGQVGVIIISTKIQSEVQQKIYQQIFKLSFAQVSKYKTGDLVEYATSPSMMISGLVDAINQTFVSLFSCLVLMGLLFWISAKLTLLVLFSFILVFFLQKKIVKPLSKISRKLSFLQAEFSKKMVQNLYGLRIIFSFQRQENAFKRMRKNVQSISYVIKKQSWLANLLTPLSEIASILLVGICLISGPFFLRLQYENIVPVLLTFLMITYRLSTRAQILSSNAGVLAKQSGFIFRMNEILCEEDKEFVEDRGRKYSEFQKNITFQNVSFKYSPALRLALDKANFEIHKGKTVAFVGRSGAGKSTILDLFVRLYEPNSGKILIDGKNLRDYSVSSWRERLGVVNQETFLFHGTIEENIRFGRLCASKEEIAKASKTAGALDFVRNLPRGFQTVVGEKGYKLSGGEKQRLALARALVRHPEILILDEATSHLDSHSEYFIQKALEKLRHKTTIIMVAHRLSTIKHADQIFLMENTKIVERGTHDTLLAQKGKYKSLWEIQSKSCEYSGI